MVGYTAGKSSISVSFFKYEFSKHSNFQSSVRLTVIKPEVNRMLLRKHLTLLKQLPVNFQIDVNLTEL